MERWPDLPRWFNFRIKGKEASIKICKDDAHLFRQIKARKRREPKFSHSHFICYNRKRDKLRLVLVATYITSRGIFSSRGYRGPIQMMIVHASLQFICHALLGVRSPCSSFRGRIQYARCRPLIPMSLSPPLFLIWKEIDVKRFENDTKSPCTYSERKWSECRPQQH